MEKLQKGLQFLLDKYTDGSKSVKLINRSTLEIGGERLPLLPWRSERRFAELKGMINDKTLSGISAMRVCRIDKKGANLDDILYRELDLCEWILGSNFTEIFTMENHSTANTVAKLENGVVCTIETAVTLSEQAKVIDKHEIISQRGVACDRVVDTQVPQQSIYVFSDKKEPNTYLDVDFELFGISADEVAIVRQAFEAIKAEEIRKELTDRSQHVLKLVELSKKSVQTAGLEVME